MLAAVVCLALPYVLPTVPLGITLFICDAFCFSAGMWSLRVKKMRTRLPTAFSAMAAGFLAVMNVDWTVHGGAASPVGTTAAMLSGTVATLAALGWLAARRPKFYRDGLLDAFAAIAAVAAIQWQIAGTTGVDSVASVAKVVLPISGAILFAAVVAVVAQMIFDKQQNRDLTRALFLVGAFNVIGAVGSKGWSDPDAPLWPLSFAFACAWLLTGSFLHSSVPALFEPEPDYERKLNVLRWLGPASALAINPVVFTILIYRGEIPSIPTGIASAFVTFVVLWRIQRLLNERELGRRELARSEERFRSLVEHSSDVIAVVGSDARVLHVSGGVEELLGVPVAALLGRNALDLFEGDNKPLLRDAVAEISNCGESTTVSSDLRVRREDRGERWVSIRITNHFDTPAIGGWVVNLHDRTERKTAEHLLAQTARHDSLTGLPNRLHMVEQINAMLATSPGTTALLFCDLDGFKAVNDKMGHGAGDEVLTSVAGRWSSLLRPNDVLGRWGGDEFLVACPNVRSPEDATDIADRLLSSLAERINIVGGSAQLGTSVGIAFHNPGETVDELVRRADAAMYGAKRSGTGLRVADAA